MSNLVNCSRRDWPTRATLEQDSITLYLMLNWFKSYKNVKLGAGNEVDFLAKISCTTCAIYNSNFDMEMHIMDNLMYGGMEAWR